MTTSWDCEVHGHLEEHGSYRCVSCGELLQMAFSDVVEAEPMPGDPSYTEWLRRGRPQITWDQYDALKQAGHDPRRTPIEDVLPGL